MKVKTRPEDFQVVELTDVEPLGSGTFALYQLRKRGIGTPEAMQQICREWNLGFDQLSYGGLKDRHAETVQYLTIQRGPRRSLDRSRWNLRYLGQVAQPFDPAHIRANRFHIVLRDLAEPGAQTVLEMLEEFRRDGVPNYFDDQRFGSVGANHEFVARKLIDCDYEAALRLALAEPYEFDRAAQKEEKRVLREHWRDWAAVKAKLPRGHVRSIVTYLADHPTDFRGAIARLRADLKSLYLAAYQSHLWNRMLSRWLELHCRPEQLEHVELRLGPVRFCRHLDDSQRSVLHAQQLPLPSARIKIAAADPIKGLIDDVLHEEGLELSRMKLKHFREPFFSKGNRAAFFLPANVAGHMELDELHSGRRKMVLSFELPRGSYATMLVKRVAAGPQELPNED
jgi:tRNA pseudouridine13 synthase